MALAKTYRNVEQFCYISEKLKDLGCQRNLEACRSKAMELRRNYKKVKEAAANWGAPGQACLSLMSLTSSSVWTMGWSYPKWHRISAAEEVH